MKAFFVSMTFAAGLFAAAASYAQAPSTAPTGSTGLCKDGSYYSGASKRGACSRHGGVKDWYGAAEAPAAAIPAPAAAAPAPAAKPAAKPAATPAPSVAIPPAAVAPAPTAAPAAAPKPASKNTLPVTAAVGGGPGKVWVNTSSKVYHCSDDRYYGKTKKGEYMTEADAKASGARAEHGKECTGK